MANSIIPKKRKTKEGYTSYLYLQTNTQSYLGREDTFTKEDIKKLAKQHNAKIHSWNRFTQLRKE